MDYFPDTCGISKSNMIAFLEANAKYCIKPSIADCSAKTYVFVGEKENKAMRKSAKIISAVLSESTLQVLCEKLLREDKLKLTEHFSARLAKSSLRTTIYQFG